MGKIIPLFPQQIKTSPLEHPVVKAFLNDIRASTVPSAIESSEDRVTMHWHLRDDFVVRIIFNVSLSTATVAAFDEVNFQVVDATIHLGENNRWVGYLIDDRS